MLIDAHLHIWRATTAYPDPTFTLVSPLSDVPLELLEQYRAEHGVDRAVLVQPLFPGEDNSYVAECAAAAPGRFAAVCVVNPSRNDAADRLEYWVRERGCRGLRIRPRIKGEDAHFGTESTFPVWERAGKLGVVVNVLANPEHLGTVGQLAERFPQVAVVLDHLAHPDVSAEVNSPRFRRLLELARYPQVYVKITGHYYYSRQAYPYADCVDLVHAVYDHFGAARLIWGSDFPHVLLKSGYRRNLLLPERAYPFINAKERAAIMGENAARLYWGERVGNDGSF